MMIRDGVCTPAERGTIVKGQGVPSDREVKKGEAKRPGVQVPFATWLLKKVFYRGELDESEWELLESCSDPAYAWQDLRKQLDATAI